ncbi:hypothetical protein [Sporosarcina pasteurii]|uniref:Uncharacterized protein n=1 Tax=Sporosarcina pasteurii TaxID=1474 RepID=A0A380C1Q6_SPOPA|nr:hypothetical protein [Sporosarcina pasteurii]MDS9471555.1 hypothetical protein [Sporosarcina pasteurii]QBQ04830.1 hypothetical protein E2C16_03695 [Sporosarcina pasteurii]SUJ11054.1 Uncharacterised protein [Sporosarcina pasteurii]
MSQEDIKEDFLNRSPEKVKDSSNWDFNLSFGKSKLNKDLIRRKDIFGSSIEKMRSIIPIALERLEQEIEVENGWKVALEIIKITGVGDKEYQRIGHDEVDKLIREEAGERSKNELFSLNNDCIMDELLNDYKYKLEHYD